MLACSSDNEESGQQQRNQEGTLTITSSVNAFEGEDGHPVTRTNIAGNEFVVGDWMKLKIICPYVSDWTQFGETNYGNTFDSFWLMKWTGSNWTPITSADKIDLGADYAYSSASALTGHYLTQQTPYVYTASTWNENVLFIAPNASGTPTLISQYTYVFHADQHEEKHYRDNDLMWAQTYMQTGSYNVHLAFNHVMACLKLDLSTLNLTTNAVVTLHGMPDIDQCEVVVGDYYAAHSKVNANYGYQQKTLCTKENNGRVLGVAIIDDSQKRALVKPMSGNPADGKAVYTGTTVDNTGIYTAHYDGGNYYLIVPPCTLATAPTLWIHDGTNRYSTTLQRTVFEQGKLYTVNVLKTAPVVEDPTNNSGDNNSGDNNSGDNNNDNNNEDNNNNDENNG